MTHMQGLGIATMFNWVLLMEIGISIGDSGELPVLLGVISVVIGEFILIFSCNGKD